MSRPIDELPALVRKLYSTTDRLRAVFPNQPWPLDGLLVGSIGEVVAAHRYGIDLHRASSKTHDGVAPDGRAVQVKATQSERGRVNLAEKPDHLLVFRIDRDGSVAELFNGPGSIAWGMASKPNRNGRSVSVRKLVAAQLDIDSGDRLPLVLDASTEHRG